MVFSDYVHDVISIRVYPQSHVFRCAQPELRPVGTITSVNDGTSSKSAHRSHSAFMAQISQNAKIIIFLVILTANCLFLLFFRQQGLPMTGAKYSYSKNAFYRYKFLTATKISKYFRASFWLRYWLKSRPAYPQAGHPSSVALLAHLIGRMLS